MAVKRFAAIDVGSYEIQMKIYEISDKKRIQEIDDIRYVMELGRETYKEGRISFHMIEELCKVLYNFREIMKEYHTDDYRANATSAIREAANSFTILDRIKVNTGLEVKIISNSEQRFLSYKAMASKEAEFSKIIEKPTAIVDVGAGSVQLSLFNKDVLVTTQNMRLGSLRIHELLSETIENTNLMNELMEELIDNDFMTFQRMFLKDKEIKNVIAVGEYIIYFIRHIQSKSKKSYINRTQFLEAYQNAVEKSPAQVAEWLNISNNAASLLLPCLMVYKKFLDQTNTETIWVPGVCLCDGLAASYSEKHLKMNFSHDFSMDIIVASRNIAKRFKSNMQHITMLEEMVLKMFDMTKKYHGLGKRERLLLQIAAILHDCGKFVSMNQSADCSYHIIMSTEIIGLSETEREIVANIVKYNSKPFDYVYEAERLNNSSIYLTVTKLVAFLRIGNAMDRSHKQKFNNCVMHLKEKELIILTDTMENISLEQTLFRKKADFFEELYGIRPVLKKKKVV